MDFDPSFRLSANFTLGMLTTTEHREFIEQNQRESLNWLSNLTRLACEVLEPVRLLIGPFAVTSAFRCAALNAAIGGSQTSQHCHGEAADIVHGLEPLNRVFNDIAGSEIPFSQLIAEFGSWVHVGIIDEKLHPGRVGQRLVASRVNGATAYSVVKTI
jgi:zinc D-Ala-D-Ala carboxypeptidase